MGRKRKYYSLEEICKSIEYPYDKHNKKRIESYIISHSNVEPVYDKVEMNKLLGYTYPQSKGIGFSPSKRGRSSTVQDSRKAILNKVIYSDKNIMSATLTAKTFGLFKKNIYEFKLPEYTKEEVEYLSKCQDELETIREVVKDQRNKLLESLRRIKGAEITRVLLIHDSTTKHVYTFAEYFNLPYLDTSSFFTDYQFQIVDECEDEIKRLANKGVGDTSLGQEVLRKRKENFENRLYNTLSWNKSEKKLFNECMRKQCLSYAGNLNWNNHSIEEIEALEFIPAYEFTPTTMRKKTGINLRAEMKVINEEIIKKIRSMGPYKSEEKLEYIIEHCIRI